MKNNTNLKCGLIALLFMMVWGCKSNQQTIKTENKTTPITYNKTNDSNNIADLNWRTYFEDKNLIALIDTALQNNQEINILQQEIDIRKNEIRAKKGEYLPSLNLAAGAGLEKAGRYTRFGAVDEQLEIKQGKPIPEPLTDLMVGAYATWEIDVWKKLRNGKKAAITRYLASKEGKNFMITNLIAEIAQSYYELMRLDNTLQIIEANIKIQSDALNVVRLQKESAKVSQLAVNRFEAQLLNTQNLQYIIKQEIVETENRINFLTGRYPHPLTRSSTNFIDLPITTVQAGIPSQLLANRPDIKQAELQLAASKLDVKSARANFYPSIHLQSGVGFQAFNPSYLIAPKSLLYNLAGDLVAPLINRSAISAAYKTANAQQIQAVYQYEKTILNAYVDVINQLNKMDNYAQSYSTKKQEVELLMQSVNIANSLFNSARADYAEVLLTQREALNSKMELLEIKMKQLNTQVNIYRALGGGWQ